ncbi:MAG: SH3 domain-containing protein [Pseudomonadota bacterium]
MERRGTCTTEAALIVLLVLLALFPSTALSKKPPLTATVKEAYIDMRTGPGYGYPVYHALTRSDVFEIRLRRTDWVKIRTMDRHLKTGWVHESVLEQQLSPVEDEPQDLGFKRFQWMIAGGDFEGASAITTSVAFKATNTLSLVGEGTHILGDVSDGWMVTAAIRQQPFSFYRVAPYLQVGAGVVRTQPFSTIVQAEDREDQTIHVGVGADIKIASRLNFFFDYRQHKVLTSRAALDEVNEWRLGFNVSY